MLKSAKLTPEQLKTLLNNLVSNKNNALTRFQNIAGISMNLQFLKGNEKAKEEVEVLEEAIGEELCSIYGSLIMEKPFVSASFLDLPVFNLVVGNTFRYYNFPKGKGNHCDFTPSITNTLMSRYTSFSSTLGTNGIFSSLCFRGEKGIPTDENGVPLYIFTGLEKGRELKIYCFNHQNWIDVTFPKIPIRRIQKYIVYCKFCRTKVLEKIGSVDLEPLPKNEIEEVTQQR